MPFLNCPLCTNQQFTIVHSCIDYTASQSKFDIVSCNDCGFMITHPQPLKEHIMSFYPAQNYISHSSTTETLTDYLYKLARNFTLKWKAKVITSHTKKGSLLDVGCGTGDFLKACKKDGWEITGVEPSETAREQAAHKTSTKIFDDLNEIQTNRFNVITLWHVLEHLYDLNQIIIKLKNLLSDDGALIFALPNPESYDAIKYKENWAGYDVPRHLWHFSKSSITTLVTNHGLNVVSIIPMKLDSYYVSLLSEKYIRGKNTLPGFVNAFLTGFKSNWKAHKTTNYSSLIYIVTK